MKIVINRCYGGFGLSPKGIEAYLARKGQKAYWFSHGRDANDRIDFDSVVPIETPDGSLFSMCYTTPDKAEGSHVYDRELERTDPDLVAVVEFLGEDANGDHAELRVIEIPDDVDWVLEEYDGIEWVAERHRTWNS